MFTKNSQDIIQTDDLIYTDATPSQRWRDPARRRMLAVTVLVLVSLLAAAVTALALGQSIKGREARYLYAQELLMMEQYDLALAEFEALGDYRDSQSQFADLTALGNTYREALDYLDKAENQQTRMAPIVHYDAAAALLENLGEYADAPALLDECYAAAAEIMLAEDQLDMALDYIGNMSSAAAADFRQTHNLEKIP